MNIPHSFWLADVLNSECVCVCVCLCIMRDRPSISVGLRQKKRKDEKANGNDVVAIESRNKAVPLYIGYET